MSKEFETRAIVYQYTNSCSSPPFNTTFSTMPFCFHRELGLLRRRSQSSHARQKAVLSSKWNQWSLWDVFYSVLTVQYSTSRSCSQFQLRIYASAFFFLDQIFSYLIVIDFESTCWRERNAYSQEISKNSSFGACLHVMTSVPEELFPLCSWVPCCPAQHVNRGGWVRIPYLRPTSGASRSVRLLHWADGNHTGSSWGKAASCTAHVCVQWQGFEMSFPLHPLATEPSAQYGRGVPLSTDRFCTTSFSETVYFPYVVR